MYGTQKSDNDLQKDVTSELLWDPRITSSHVSVSAKDGIVTLRGDVPHYFEKTAAEEAAQRVGGVKAVADEIEVKLMGTYERSDEDIAQAALNALEWSFSVPKGMKVVVQRGWITLSGEVDWDYERNAAKDAVSSLMGVSGVSNSITIKSSAQRSDIKTGIEEALKRSAESEGRKINVAVSGDQVTLSGNVHSFSEVTDAGLAAWNAKGVMSVVNNIRVEN
jgi:osmotically-inducible protein OsmY